MLSGTRDALGHMTQTLGQI